jgi:glycosyltransferase involved in cell wall biosynthesis
MRVLITHPKNGSAIHRLSVSVEKYNPHHQIRVVAVHPKRPDPQQLQDFLDAYLWCDIWDAQYWKTAEMLRERFGDIIRDNPRPSILTHHNPYDLMEKDWSHYDKVVVMNKTQQKVLKNALHIAHSVDLNELPWNPDYTERKTVMMCAQRIEGKKGVLPVAQACKELGFNFLLVGEVSDQDYFLKVIQTGIVTFMERISDEELYKAYCSSAIHVCNSVDNFESGTLPILEAMAVGVPVMTRMIGHVPETYNGKNMLIREGASDDVEDIKGNLQMLMNDREKRLTMREEAWHTVRNYSAERRARAYSSLYYKTYYKNPLVSVIMPVFGHHEEALKLIDNWQRQSYPALELVVVSDGDPWFDGMDWEAVAKVGKHTIKYFNTGKVDSYGLGYARDLGVCEAEGEIIVFFDQRFLPDDTLVEEFVKNLHPKQWLYGNKNNKRNFVENISCIYRQEFIDMGMSNQLITAYGGMSQELRERSKRQGIKHVFIENAKAEAQYSSHNYNSKKKEIRAMKEILWKLRLV